jgi:electron transfer flavoprotein alpha/beta subunit
MKILVFVRRLRAQADPREPAPLAGLCDQAALAAALALRTECKAQVTAVSAGAAAVERPLLSACLAAGCDRAVVIDHSETDGDYLATAMVCAAAAKTLGFDLLLCGERSPEQGSGALGPALAELVGVPHCGSSVFDLAPHAGEIEVTRVAAGFEQVSRVVLPAVIAVARFVRGESALGPVQRAAHEPQPPSDHAQRIEQLTVADIGVAADRLRERARYAGDAQPAEPARPAHLFADAAALVARLRADHLLD